MAMPFSLSGKKDVLNPIFKQLHTRDGRRLALGQIHHRLECHALAVHQLDGVAQFFFGNGYVKFFFKIGDEQLKLVPPVGKGVIVLHLRQLQQEYRLVGREQLVHLFAVAGGVGYHHICRAEIGDSYP